ncbi:MAG TPA: hypothetical protein VHB77_15610, partial [Planctomycetaceae bacterium]|nr:hypothetical protein [Planctomycetaceae bacterium]
MVSFTWRGWVEQKFARRVRSARSSRRPMIRSPQIEPLELRLVLTSITVTESGMGNDGNGVGPGKDGSWSLLEAIEFIDSQGGSGDTITLATNVTVSGALPAITEDDFTLVGGGFTITGGGLEIDGDNANVSNVTFQNSSDSSLVINGNNAVLDKVTASGAAGDSISITGDNAKVTGTKSFNNGGSGLIIEGNSATVGGTSSSDQVILYGAGSPTSVQLAIIGNSGLVEGDLIGTKDGTTASNSGIGLYIQGASNTIGGTSSSARNIISGNGGQGVEIHEVESVDNLVEGNYIGVDSSGSKALGNLGSGISIGFGATNNTVGGTSSDEQNVISGNGLDGVAIGESGTKGNLVEGNLIGTDVSGTKAIGNGLQNGFFGVEILDGAQNNTIGGTADGALNVISGNYAGIG